MEALNAIFIEYGYFGMAMAAFLAGTFVPFSSEAVLAALLAMSSMDPWLTIAWASVGNIAGSMFNYYIGRFGDTKTIAKWLKVKEKRIVKAKDFVEKRGSWIAIFTFLPILGTAIAVAMGMLRINIFKVLFYTTLGKVIRYIIVGYTVIVLKGAV